MAENPKEPSTKPLDFLAILRAWNHPLKWPNMEIEDELMELKNFRGHADVRVTPELPRTYGENQQDMTESDPFLPESTEEIL